MVTNKHRRILVIKLGALGDVVLALGPFEAIRKHHPKAHIVLLTTTAFKDFLQSSGYFDEIWTDNRPGFWKISEWRKLKSKLRGANFTRVYDLQTSDRSSWYFRLFSRKGRPEWSGIARGCSYPHNNPKRNFMHSIERQKEQLAIAGISSVPSSDLSWVNSDISRFGINNKFFLLIPGGSAHRLAKRWPVDFYAEIASKAIGKGFQPVVIGSVAENLLGIRIKSKCSGTINLCGKTKLDDLVVLGREAVFAVGNDTGPIHMVAATGCRTVVLFSAESDPALTAPRGEDVSLLRQENLSELSVESVAAALRLV
ncbi:MAG: ADP-heptose--LPS heptosyltransferase [Rhodospirillaceae bacterium]|nr:ADP-heptose--LPS heptosyltransferase [Rhodospirillaceae bacterium]